MGYRPLPPMMPIGASAKLPPVGSRPCSRILDYTKGLLRTALRTRIAAYNRAHETAQNHLMIVVMPQSTATYWSPSPHQ